MSTKRFVNVGGLPVELGGAPITGVQVVASSDDATTPGVVYLVAPSATPGEVPTIQVAGRAVPAVVVDGVEVWSTPPLVTVGGVEQSRWATSAFYNGGATEALTRTIISPGTAVRANTMAFGAVVNVNGGANQAKLRLWRAGSGSTWNMVAEHVFNLAGAGPQTVSFYVPWAVSIGDVVGVHLVGPTGRVNAGDHEPKDALFATGDLAGSGVTLGSSAAQDLEIHLLGSSPRLAYTGDSILAGDTDWRTHLDTEAPGSIRTIPGGDVAFDLGSRLATRITGLTWANCARGSQTFAWGAQVNGGFDAVAAFAPEQAIVGFGVNDVSGGRLWADVEANLDTIYGKAVAAGIELFIIEILPWTAGNNAQAATIRTWNSNLAVWCGDNAVTLIPTHDDMGQTRVGTGQVDDLKTVYNKDGVHLTSAGVDALAALIAPHLTA